ncbi:hypothetical protein DPEC_G00101660 [Dallia pectoralis]|uniref:Uncharacterized protein n=1 Tax=Dallia pectoralis TaxID=75939 RepID=A0ACC2GWS0_DALPE|nr:hypothetical protein DPEC_G00101660 [Dallia pectoralis]
MPFRLTRARLSMRLEVYGDGSFGFNVNMASGLWRLLHPSPSTLSLHSPPTSTCPHPDPLTQTHTPETSPLLTPPRELIQSPVSLMLPSVRVMERAEQPIR